MTAAAIHLPRAIASQALPAPRFLYTPVLRAGDFVFISGMVALDPASGGLAAGDAEAQTARILANLRGLLDEQGWSREQLVLARIFCTDFSEFPGINRAWEAFFGDSSPPARTAVGVSALPLGAAVEIEFQLLAGPDAAPSVPSHGASHG